MIGVDSRLFSTCRGLEATVTTRLAVRLPVWRIEDVAGLQLFVYTTNPSPLDSELRMHMLSAGVRLADSSQRFLRHFEIVLISLGSAPHVPTSKPVAEKE